MAKIDLIKLENKKFLLISQKTKDNILQRIVSSFDIHFENLKTKRRKYLFLAITWYLFAARIKYSFFKEKFKTVSLRNPKNKI